VPDALVIGIVQEQMKRPDLKDKGWILDGFPRTKVQAEALSKAGIVPDKIVFLDVPDSVLVERVCGRRMDPTTGAIYHVKYKPPPAEVAARCITRADDTDEKLKTRLIMYHNNNKNILEYYEGSVPVDKIDGTKLPDEVYVGVKASVSSKNPFHELKTTEKSNKEEEEHKKNNTNKKDEEESGKDKSTDK